MQEEIVLEAESGLITTGYGTLLHIYNIYLLTIPSHRPLSQPQSPHVALDMPNLNVEIPDINLDNVNLDLNDLPDININATISEYLGSNTVQDVKRVSLVASAVSDIAGNRSTAPKADIPLPASKSKSSYWTQEHELMHSESQCQHWIISQGLLQTP